jgi:Protein of Unknown function (DUF2784)
MWYRAGADLVVVVHLLVIGFIVGGVFLTWRWPLIIWAHIPAVIYGALVEFAGFTCPLTLLENDLRQRAGEAGYRDGFIAHYLVKVIYPPGLTHGMQIGLGVLLLLVAMIGYWGFLRRRGALARALANGSRPEHGEAQRHGAAVASSTHRQSRALAPKVAQPVEGRLLTGWLPALVRLIHRHRCPSPLGEPPSDENGPGARMRSELFCGRGQ